MSTEERITALEARIDGLETALRYVWENPDVQARLKETGAACACADSLSGDNDIHWNCEKEKVPEVLR